MNKELFKTMPKGFWDTIGFTDPDWMIDPQHITKLKEELEIINSRLQDMTGLESTSTEAPTTGGSSMFNKYIKKAN